MKHLVAIGCVEGACYPQVPFDPPNPVYHAVEQAMASLGLDADRIGQRDWNPLGFIPLGSRVLLKPNLVRHFHPYGYSTECLFTHGSVIRAVCDYVLKALRGTGEVVIADAPLQTCNFSEVCRLSGITAIVDSYGRAGVDLSVRDLRLVRSEVRRRGWMGNVLTRQDNGGDPLGYTTVRLDEDSLHAARQRPGRYRVTCYDPAAMERHHGEGRHRYIIANSLLEADFVINLPKIKTHQKAGLTGALKNFVGINGHKDCLPHHVAGSAGSGGDEYAASSFTKRLDSWLQDFKEVHDNAAFRKAVGLAHRLLHPIHMSRAGNAYWAGSWYGNDTISRTTIDLNRIVRYARRDGTIASDPQRSLFHIADAVVAGEGDGPLAPTPKPAGLILAAENPVAMDLIVARFMGYRWNAIPTLRHAVNATGPRPLFQTGDVVTCSAWPAWQGLTPDSVGPSLDFQAHRGWREHVELAPEAVLT